MQINIQWFKNIDNLTLKWDLFLIEWSNWTGKSSILEAIEYSIFNTINWKSKWLSWYTKNWYEKFIVDSDLQKLPSYYRPVIFCDILNQQPVEVRKILILTLMEDKLKKRLSKVWQWDVEKTFKYIKKQFSNYSKNYKKLQNEIELLQSQLSNLEEVDDEEIKALEIKIENTEATISLDKLKNELTNLQDKEEKLLLDLASLQEWKCPMCNQPYSNENKLNTIKKEIKLTRKQIKDIKHMIDTHDDSYSQYVKRLIQLQSIKQERDRLERLIQEKIESLDTIDNTIEDYYQYISHDIYKELEVKLKPVIDITFFAPNTYASWETLTVLVHKKWIEYKYLSLSEKLLLNMELSKLIYNWPLFIDNTEIVDDIKKIKIKQWILCRVSNNDLKIKKIK